MKQNILLLILILLISRRSQKETEPSFSLQEETSSITLASAASSQTVISFTSTREWKASTSSEWLLISPTSGEAGTYQMDLTASSKKLQTLTAGILHRHKPLPGLQIPLAARSHVRTSSINPLIKKLREKNKRID